MPPLLPLVDKFANQAVMSGINKQSVIYKENTCFVQFQESFSKRMFVDFCNFTRYIEPVYQKTLWGKQIVLSKPMM